MTRQETVIKITKITRIVGEMKSQLDLDDEIEFEALDSSWMNIGDGGVMRSNVKGCPSLKA